MPGPLNPGLGHIDKARVTTASTRRYRSVIETVGVWFICLSTANCMLSGQQETQNNQPEAQHKENGYAQKQ